MRTLLTLAIAALLLPFAGSAYAQCGGKANCCEQQPCYSAAPRRHCFGHRHHHGAYSYAPLSLQVAQPVAMQSFVAAPQLAVAPVGLSALRVSRADLVSLGLGSADLNVAARDSVDLDRLEAMLNEMRDLAGRADLAAQQSVGAARQSSVDVLRDDVDDLKVRVEGLEDSLRALRNCIESSLPAN